LKDKTAWHGVLELGRNIGIRGQITVHKTSIQITSVS
jgi:hypothetical protein